MATTDGTTPAAPEPVPVVVAEYGTYPEAQSALERLRRDGVPDSKVSLVWSRLRQVESSGGRAEASAALEGAVGGACLGGAAGILLSLFVALEEGVSVVTVVVTWTIVVALLGAGWQVAIQRARRNRRSVSAIGELAAESYQVWVDDDAANRATAVLGAERTERPPDRPTGGRRSRSAARARVHATAASLLASPPPAPAPADPPEARPA